jgi:hypothetical protein
VKHSRFKDLTGHTFGERVVLEYSHQVPASGNYVWEVQCSCGRKDKVTASRLRTGKADKCLSCSSKVNGRKGLYKMSEGKPVYFIRCCDFVKIGSSWDVERRLKDLETSNPHPLELIKVDYEKGERYWHDKFKEYLHRNEWYSKEIVDLT